MTIFIVGLVLLALCLVFIAISITKAIIYKRVSKFNKEIYEVLKQHNTGWELIMALAVGYVGIFFTVYGTSDVREYFVKQYDDHIYEWNQSAYVNDSGEVKVSKERHLKKVKDISDRKTLYLTDTTKCITNN